MKVYYSKRQLEHRPQQIMLLGKLSPPVENPDRLEVLARRLTEAGLKETPPADHGREAIEAVHSADYVDFLASSYVRWAANPKAGPEVLPNTHPYRGKGSALNPSSRPLCSVVNAQAGWYIGDLNCAIGAGTWRAVYEFGAGRAVCGARGYRWRPLCIRALPPAGTSCIRRPRLRLLLPQQRRHCRRSHRQTGRQSGHPRFRHASRRRHAGDLL